MGSVERVNLPLAQRRHFQAKHLSLMTAFFALLFVAGVITGCENKRPPGFLSIGKVSEVGLQSSFLKDKQIYLRRDQRGVSVMSTLCSYDLSPLRLVQINGKDVFVTDYNQSQYDLEGNVLHGPATQRLPYYRARVDSGVYGGPKDTIYVEIGKEVDPNWRLTVP